jgi:hypothetical protein
MADEFINPFNSLNSKSIDQRAEWFGKYFRDASTDPSIKISWNYRRPVDFLVKCFSVEEDKIFAAEMGDAIALSLKSSLDEKETPLPDGDADLLDQYLFALENLPTSGSSEFAFSLLDEMRVNEGYKKLPSNRSNLHNRILLVMCNQVPPHEASPSQWPEKLKFDLNDSSYCIAAFCLCLRVCPEEAIPKLTDILTILRNNKIPSLNFMFSNALYLEAHYFFCYQFAKALKDVEWDKEAGELFGWLQKLEKLYPAALLKVSRQYFQSTPSVSDLPEIPDDIKADLVCTAMAEANTARSKLKKEKAESSLEIELQNIKVSTVTKFRCEGFDGNRKKIDGWADTEYNPQIIEDLDNVSSSNAA